MLNMRGSNTTHRGKKNSAIAYRAAQDLWPEMVEEGGGPQGSKPGGAGITGKQQPQASPASAKGKRLLLAAHRVYGPFCLWIELRALLEPGGTGLAQARGQLATVVLMPGVVAQSCQGTEH